MIAIEDRIKFYLGDTHHTNYKPDIIDPVRQDIPFYTTQDYRTLKSDYVSDVNRYRSLSGKNFWCQCGDEVYLKQNFPLLIKVRDFQKQSNGVIGNLHSVRHWGACKIAASTDIKWKNKQDTIVWRGSTTGMNPKLDRKYTRETFVKDYYNDYNVGFAAIVQSCDHLKQYYRPRIYVKDMLQYKYIVSIDGNDKSSSINWILYSNSIPIMSKPRYHSWLCETYLIPGVHYVEVKEDFSDLKETIEWCKNNDDQCKEIANNGRSFILENFTDIEKEQYIEKELINRMVV